MNVTYLEYVEYYLCEAKTWFRSPVQGPKERVDLSSSKVRNLMSHSRSVRAGETARVQPRLGPGIPSGGRCWRKDR